MGGKWKGRVCRQSRKKGERQKEAECESYLATKAEGTGHPGVQLHNGKQKTGGKALPWPLMTKGRVISGIWSDEEGRSCGPGVRGR